MRTGTSTGAARRGPRPCTSDLDGPFSWVDHGRPDGGRVVVAVHGLGGSHANWHVLASLPVGASTRTRCAPAGAS